VEKSDLIAGVEAYISDVEALEACYDIDELIIYMTNDMINIIQSLDNCPLKKQYEIMEYIALEDCTYIKDIDWAGFFNGHKEEISDILSEGFENSEYDKSFQDLYEEFDRSDPLALHEPNQILLAQKCFMWRLKEMANEAKIF
jgi:hypothetical protein